MHPFAKLAGAVLLAMPLAGWSMAGGPPPTAAAPAASAAAPQEPSPRAIANAQALEKADAAFVRARQACLAHPPGIQARCLEEARQAHEQAMLGAAGTQVPAVQTQSAAVRATGAAPVAVDERTPGTLAIPPTQVHPAPPPVTPTR